MFPHCATPFTDLVPGRARRIQPQQGLRLHLLYLLRRQRQCHCQHARSISYEQGNHGAIRLQERRQRRAPRRRRRASPRCFGPRPRRRTCHSTPPSSTLQRQCTVRPGSHGPAVGVRAADTDRIRPEPRTGLQRRPSASSAAAASTAPASARRRRGSRPSTAQCSRIQRTPGLCACWIRCSSAWHAYAAEWLRRSSSRDATAWLWRPASWLRSPSTRNAARYAHEPLRSPTAASLRTRLSAEAVKDRITKASPGPDSVNLGSVCGQSVRDDLSLEGYYRKALRL